MPLDPLTPFLEGGESFPVRSYFPDVPSSFKLTSLALDSYQNQTLDCMSVEPHVAGLNCLSVQSEWLNSVGMPADLYSPPTSALSASSISSFPVSPLSSIEFLPLSADAFSPLTAGMSSSNISSPVAHLPSTGILEIGTDVFKSSPWLAAANPLFNTEAYKSALDTFPRPISFVNPSTPLTSDSFHVAAPLENTPWLTSPSGFTDPYCGLVNVLEASRLTKLTNDLVLLGTMAGMPAASSAFSPVFRDFQNASKRYCDLIQAAEVSIFDPTSVAIPARSYFASADALLQFQRNWEISAPLQKTRETTREEIQRRTEDKLEVMLKKIDPRLRKLWRGARMIAASKNPEKTRYASVSLRELMTQVLHTLAPDAEVRRWTSDPCQLPNGRPTRETRLLYICQPIANGALSDYIRADIRAVIALGNVLQEGTHGVDADFSPLQLRLIFNRLEGALCSLIEVSEASE